MKSSTLLMTLLVLANVLLLATGLTLYEELDYGISFPLLGLTMAQAGLLATWLALGRTKASLRLISVSAGMLLLDVVVKECEPGLKAFSGLFLANIVGIFIALLAMRMLGLRLVHRDIEQLEPSTVSGQPRFQFTLRQMFGWTTAVAVLCSALTTIGFGGIVASLSDTTDFVFVFVLPSLFPLLVALWAVLGMRTLASRFILLALVYPAASLAYGGLLGADADAIVMMLGTTGIVLLGSLAVCRVAGYRIGWQGRRMKWGRPDIED